jgi:hypothetical protein
LTIDFDQPEFTVAEKMILRELADHHERYEAQGRDFEARGVYKSIVVIYRRLKGDFVDTEPTHWASL